MSIWEKMGFGGYKGFSHASDQLLRGAVELAGDLGCERGYRSSAAGDPAAGSRCGGTIPDQQTDL